MINLDGNRVWLQFFRPAEVQFLEFVRDSSGRVQDAVVEFGNDNDYQLALSRHKQHMGRMSSAETYPALFLVEVVFGL